MDFSDAPYLIDGVYKYLFAVRDLATSYQLGWFAVPDEQIETILPLLRQLFEEHGPPLVLKSDNGSAFIALVLKESLGTHRVCQLFSPARRPQYNGALERSNGVLKTYTGVHAIHEGHPFRWTSDDLEHASQLANTISRPWGHKGPTPAEAWQARQPLTDEQRRTFVELVQTHLPQAAADLGLPDVALLSASQYRMASRMAISRALEQSGYLSMKRARRRKRRRKAQRAPSADPPSSSSTGSTAPSPAAQAARCAPASGKSVDRAQPPNHRAADAAECAPSAAPQPTSPQREKNSAGLLAQSPARVKMTSGTDAPRNGPTDGQPRGSPHGERSIYTWLRRLFTPPLRNQKAAKIP
jgi:transposase InsO family protein